VTYKTGQMSPRAVFTFFKTLWLRDRWADVDETWHVYAMGPGTKLLGSGILNFAPTPHPLRRARPPQT